MWFLLILLVLVLVAYLDTRKPKNFPPGPAWFPLIGCAWQLHRLRRRMGHLTKASQELAAKYGPLVGVRIGRERAVFVYGLQAIEEMYTRDELNGRPIGLLSTSRTGGTRKGIIFTDSEFFQEQKKFLQRELKQSGFRKEILMENIQREVRAIIDNVKRKIKDNCAVTSDRLFGEQLLQSVWVLMAGNESHLDDLGASELHRVMVDLSHSTSLSCTAFSNFPFLKYICPDYCGYNPYVRVNRTVIEFSSKMIQGLRKTGSPNASLIRAYLETMDSVGKSNFTMDQLMGICLDIFTGGFETTNNTLCFAMYYVVVHPDFQTKAQDELDRVVGRERLPTLEDKPQLPYVEAVVLESLRMFTGRSFLIPRRAMKDTTFNGYFIPKDTVLFGNSRGTFMDPNSGWPNTSVFNPERFMKDGSLNVPDGFIPFGIGKRRCLGEVFAKANLFLIIAGLLHTFNFRPVPGDPPHFEVMEGLTAGVKPFKMIVSLR
ncbi:hypothetical protein PPYR_14349 [Photinus pyralis]|uniref:Cytochrome P450 n=2 Tax=Photinus pyralis TaxID=7054 RepID=A0A5N4A4F5_PHOPY|nr:probable cytochrome P450 303a1 [Photinus pyralis]XP_031357695.1 probable cytochrome P450 303a1 [Photinus pyralis]KAB0792149.1 hypothetical protein PPYR_14108 [Photinus pyralis]KAB0792390.1 hypothetical protein PPYR_14349 [Photinus pyralis]